MHITVNWCVGGTIREVNWHPLSYIFMEAHAPHTLFSCWLCRKIISLNAMVYFQNTCFWKIYVLLLLKFNQQACVNGLPYKEIFNNLFFRFFRNLCNILHECDSSATAKEKPGTKWRGSNNIVPSKSWSWKIFLQALHFKALFVMSLKSHFFCLFVFASES